MTADLPAHLALHLGGDARCALAFATAVAAQLAYPPGAIVRGAEDAAERERWAVVRLEPVLAAAYVEARRDGTPNVREVSAAAALALAADHELLAACYPNLDLLPHGCRAGDRVAEAVARALELLSAGTSP